MSNDDDATHPEEIPDMPPEARDLAETMMRHAFIDLMNQVTVPNSVKIGAMVGALGSAIGAYVKADMLEEAIRDAQGKMADVARDYFLTAREPRGNA